ncbi:hypothetical protein ACLOJK_006890 [Asimina triloba]
MQSRDYCPARIMLPWCLLLGGILKLGVFHVGCEYCRSWIACRSKEMGSPIGAATKCEGEVGCCSDGVLTDRRRCCLDGEEMVITFMVGSHGCHWGRRGSRRHCFYADGVAGSV